MFNDLSDEEFCNEVNRLLIKYCSKNHDIKEKLSDHFGKSFSYIKQRYRRTARKTVFAQHEEFILNEAKNLLTKSFCIEVMLDLGFKNESYFTKWFKKYTDMNPSEYKKSLE